MRSLFCREKNLFDHLFVKGWYDFLSRCLSKVDHGKISKPQVPLSSPGDHCQPVVRDLFDKIFLQLLFVHLFYVIFEYSSYFALIIMGLILLLAYLQSKFLLVSKLPDSPS